MEPPEKAAKLNHKRLGVRVHCRVTPRDRPSIRFLFVESEFWATAPFRFHLAMDSLACPSGSDHHGPQRTSTSKSNAMPGTPNKKEPEHAGCSGSQD
jgi:hypothetical protein